MTMEQDCGEFSRGVTPFSSARISDRMIDELVGLCRGLIADGSVSEGEARYLLDWIEKNREVSGQWPARDLYRRLRQMLTDGQIDVEEQNELLGILKDLTGGYVSTEDRVVSYSSQLPLTQPPPVVEFTGRSFCLTGKFAYGSRKKCEAEVLARGGSVQGAPSRTTGFLVIGMMGSIAWIHSTHGRKIEQAVAFREEGLPLHIICEPHWVEALAR